VCALVTLVGILLSASGAFADSHQATSLDLLISGGRVIDPASGTDAVLDVGVSDGRIATVGGSGGSATETLDATGLVLAPGFIDVHVHGQNPLAYDFMARDGVTTAMDLELGAHGVARVLTEREGRARINYGFAAGHIPARVKWSTGLSAGHVPTRGAGFTAWLFGIVRRWLQPTGFATDPADAEDITKIVAILDEQLDEGGIGIGMGLAYTPGASEDEVRAVFALAARRGVPCFVHLGSRTSPADTAPIEAILEHVRATNASLHVLHIGSSGGDAVREYLDAIAQARSDGFDVTVEVYPYTASSTFIESEVYAPGWRERSGTDYGDLQWVATGERLTRESFERYRKQGGAVIHHSMKAENVAYAVAHPRVMIASDGMALYDGGEHPRSAGSHARVLGRYVREQQAVTLQDAIRKLTWMPAQRLEGFVPAMKKKGRIEIGADADLTLFDPDTVLDRATFEDSHQPSAGIPHVLVGGVFVVRDGELVEGALPGRAIRGE
jgi:dihydroorotase